MEDFAAVEFRDSPLGRVAYAQGTRVQVAFVYGQLQRDAKLTPRKLAESFAWPLCQTNGALAYIDDFFANVSGKRFARNEDDATVATKPA